MPPVGHASVCVRLDYKVQARFPSISLAHLLLSLVGSLSSEESWRRHLPGSAFSADQANAIISSAMTVVRWTRSGALEHSIALLQETCLCTWFSIGGMAGVSKFISGAFAGASLA